MTDASTRAGDLPLVVLGGYLGAGKTTLLNHLLRHAGGRRIAVLVNDFGEINIDAELIEGQDGQTLSLAGGCVCCTFGADLVGTLAGLAQRTPRPDIAVIELSGVALPGAVMRTARLAPGIAVQACVVLADATDIGRLVADPYVGDTVRQQLADADLVLLTKTDSLTRSDPAVEEIASRLRPLASRARLIADQVDELPVEVVLDWHPAPHAGHARLPTWPTPATGRPLRPGTMVDAHHARQCFVAVSRMMPERVDATALARRLADSATGLLRAKGLLRDEQGQSALLQMVGPRWQLTPHAFSGAGRLVTIGVAGQWDEARLDEALRAASADASRR